MLEDYIFSDSLRYEQHTLIKQTQDEPICIKGVLGAALASAMIVDTDEGNRRNIMLDTDEDLSAWMDRYEREVRRDGWGLLQEETNLLSEAYIQLEMESLTPDSLCSNNRLLNLAMHITVAYMERLVLDTYKEHIWEVVKWHNPFGQWLLDAAFVETKRQRFLQLDWTSASEVAALANEDETNLPYPTFVFENELPADIMARYFKQMWASFQLQIRAIPGANPKSQKHKNCFLAQEIECTDFADFIDTFDEQNQALWHQWMSDWQTFITAKLKPERPVRFWENGLSEERQEQFLDYLKLQERQPMRYKCLSIAVYSLRYLGYVRRACSVKDMAKWLSEHLANDYSSKNNYMQFKRAFEQRGRYTEEVQNEIANLASFGVYKFNGTQPAEQEESYLPSLSSTDLT